MVVLCSVDACLHVLVGHHALMVTIFGTTHCTLVPVEWQGGCTEQYSQKHAALHALGIVWSNARPTVTPMLKVM